MGRGKNATHNKIKQKEQKKSKYQLSPTDDRKRNIEKEMNIAVSISA